MTEQDSSIPPRAPGEALPRAFFERNPLVVAPELLGCEIESAVDGAVVRGRIVECEAYLGAHDPGSHAATRGMTPRNAAMYGPPGSAYVYFTYGNHHMLNLVCEKEGIAGAVLLRGLEPVSGIEVMRARRDGRPLHELCNGPGKLACALGVDLADNLSLLGEGRLRVYAGGLREFERMGVSGRVGLSRGHELQYRYFIEGDPHVSTGRTGPARTRAARSGGAGR